MKEWQKALIAAGVVIAVLMVAGVGFFVYIILGVQVKDTDDLSCYQALSGETDGETTMPILGERTQIVPVYGLPLLKEMEPYSACRFNYTHKRAAVFNSNAYVLAVEYEDMQSYERMKAKLECSYAYLTDEVYGVEPECKMNDFVIHAAEGGNYPKEMLFLGFSDTRQEITIIYYYDVELDMISVPLGKFINTETGWSKVVS